MKYDTDRLRRDLIDYYGTGMQCYQTALAELGRVERASDSELIKIAEKNGFNIGKYQLPPT